MDINIENATLLHTFIVTPGNHVRLRHEIYDFYEGIYHRLIVDHYIVDSYGGTNKLTDETISDISEYTYYDVEDSYVRCTSHNEEYYAKLYYSVTHGEYCSVISKTLSRNSWSCPQ